MVPLRDDYDSFSFFGSGGNRDEFRPPPTRIEPAVTSVVLLVSFLFVANCPLTPARSPCRNPLFVVPVAAFCRRSRTSKPFQSTILALTRS